MGNLSRASALAIITAFVAASPASAGVPHVVQPGETLWTIAAANNFTTRALAAANGLSEDSNVILGSTIQIPSVAEASTALSAQPAAPAQQTASAPAASGGYAVQLGDTLSGIAVAHGVSTSALAAANGLSPTSFVIEGTTLQIPSAQVAPAQQAASAPAPSSTAPLGGYAVQPGDTLSGIAAARGVSISALAAANGLSPTSFVIEGTTLQIPSAQVAPPTPAGAPQPLGGYTVRPGDTLAGIAETAGVPVEQLAFMNGLNPLHYLLSGTVLKLPTGSPAPSTSVAAPAPVVPQAAPNPTPERVTSAEIAAVAAQHGVPSGLASAIAWQESGFNNAMVSSANARGVMQIMPGTWDWVNQNLGANALNPNSALDNVRGGVLYLRQLLNDFGGDQNSAIAAYYQGEGAVKSRGLYPETQQYVNSVNALRSRFGG